MTSLAFVYGTLKRRHGNNRLLRRHAAEDFGNAVTTLPHLMWAGGFPMIKPGTGPLSGYVTGELYRVTADCVEDLDGLEGNGFMYQRQLIVVRADGGRVFHAEGYIWLKGTEHLDPVRPDAARRLTWGDVS